MSCTVLCCVLQWCAVLVEYDCVVKYCAMLCCAVLYNDAWDVLACVPWPGMTGSISSAGVVLWG